MNNIILIYIIKGGQNRGVSNYRFSGGLTLKCYYFNKDPNSKMPERNVRDRLEATIELQEPTQNPKNTYEACIKYRAKKLTIIKEFNNQQKPGQCSSMLN